MFQEVLELPVRPDQQRLELLETQLHLEHPERLDPGLLGIQLHLEHPERLDPGLLGIPVAQLHPESLEVLLVQSNQYLLEFQVALVVPATSCSFHSVKNINF